MTYRPARGSDIPSRRLLRRGILGQKGIHPWREKSRTAPGIWIRSERIVPESNVQREYAVYVGPDLFGGWALLCTRGRTGGFQRSRVRCFPKLSRGYRIVARA